MVKGEGWGRREGRREPTGPTPSCNPWQEEIVAGAAERDRARSSGGRVGLRAGRTRAEAPASRRSRGRGLGFSDPGLGSLPHWDPSDTLGSLLPGAGGAAMLLAGGDPPAQEWVMVQIKSKPRVQRQRLQVQRIFRVKLNAFQSRPDSPYFWLQLEGPRENMGKAKVNSFFPPVPSCQTPLPLRCHLGRQGPLELQPDP